MIGQKSSNCAGMFVHNVDYGCVCLVLTHHSLIHSFIDIAEEDYFKVTWPESRFVTPQNNSNYEKIDAKHFPEGTRS